GLVIGLAVLRAAGNREQTAIPQQPTFRAGTTIVPLNVTVLDKNQRPVTDLKAEDFTVYEDNVPQKISVFAPQALTAEPVDLNAPIGRGTRQTGDALTPQHRRVFLVMFSYGKQQQPTKVVDGTLTFLRQHLLPQDAVAVMLFNRATDLTTDHEYVARV